MKPRKPATSRHNGFALVATLSLLILLAVLALGMLSLSSISLRSESHGSAQAQARANARMALMIALGELQKEMGPDQRISVTGDNFPAAPDAAKHWTAALDSWIAGPMGDGQVTVNPKYPMTRSHHQTLAIGANDPQNRPRGRPADAEMRPDYTEHKSKYFRRWLLSLQPDEAVDRDLKDLALDGKAMPGSNDDAVRLVGAGSLGATADEVDYVGARLMDVSPRQANAEKRGRYAWYVADESMKAKIAADDYELQTTTLTDGERVQRLQSAGSGGNKTFQGLEDYNEEKDLAALPSMASVDLVSTDPARAASDPRPSEANFHHATIHSRSLLTDPREGGLKRDLSTLLEREIRPEEVYVLAETRAPLINGTPNSRDYFKEARGLVPDGDSFMLYRMYEPDEKLVVQNQSHPLVDQASVPLQDLAAYHQMYDWRRSARTRGVEVASKLIPDGIQVRQPNYGTSMAREENDEYLRQYTHLYRMVVPVKMQIVFGAIARPLPAEEVDPADPDPDTHYLDFVITPSVTLWNPFNVPVSLSPDDLLSPEFSSTAFFAAPLPFKIGLYKNRKQEGSSAIHQNPNGHFALWIGGNEPVVFQPGESKIFSYKAIASIEAEPEDAETGEIDGAYYGYQSALQAYPGMNTDKFIYKRGAGTPTLRIQNEDDYADVNPNSGNAPPIQTVVRGPDGEPLKDKNGNTITKSEKFTFKSGDVITGNIFGDPSQDDPPGFNFMPGARQTEGGGAGTAYHYAISRFTTPHGFKLGIRVIGSRFMKLAEPEGAVRTYYSPNSPNNWQVGILPKNGSDFILGMGINPNDISDDLPTPLAYYAFMAGTETNIEANGNSAPAGRKHASRPFLHSSPLTPKFIGNINPQGFYLNGWNLFVNPLNDLNDIPIQVTGADSDFYGGGYTAENGVVNAVQQFLPLVPPISMAEYSNARLSGYSIAGEPAARTYLSLPDKGGNEAAIRFQRNTAHGFNMSPSSSIQSIGNSYAHPLIKHDRTFNSDWLTPYYRGNDTSNAPDSRYSNLLVDHSYLANKALWDDYFLSSISPKPADNPLMPGPERTAKETAEEFFLRGGKLANRKMVAIHTGMPQAKLDELYTDYSKANGGLADKIGQYLMVDGGFSVNSTSEEAWRALFSSLREKGVVYLDSAKAETGTKSLDFEAADGVPVAGGSVTNNGPYTGSPTDPGDAEQWSGWRMLTTDEIGELAAAMVKQVKDRGPFLSLSEFINRRLDPKGVPTSGNPSGDPEAREKSKMGALQAAIDDPDCSINEGFRTSDRQFTAQEKLDVNPLFREAMDGAVAYGSNAYVDQADVLRAISGQLTVRGDTFVIRTYGDSLDSAGNVVARAWCEAVVQRMPEYVDSTEPAHTKRADIIKPANKSFGRTFEIESFRWLNASEI